MPTYEYACTSCGNHIEAYQSFTDEPLETCENCGGRLRRVFHAVGVLFKGTGFYSTDAKAKKGGEKSKPTSESKKSGDKKASDAGASPAPKDSASSEKSA